jgi:methylphosphotriester-DNA--protein-cysteine methyltransferase
VIKLGSERKNVSEIAQDRNCGHSPLSVISLKENEVRYYLKNTNYSLTKIAALLGFANVSHLWNFCIKMTGMPPNKIREDKVDQPAEEKT